MNKKMVNNILNILYFIYFVMLFKMLFFKYVPLFDIFNSNREIIRSVSLVPFHSIKMYLSNGRFLKPISMINVYGNILLFVPLGIYLPLYKKRKNFIKNLLYGLIIATGVEVVQFVFALGVMDIDDVILNTLGFIVGLLTYTIFLKLFKDSDKIKAAIVSIFILFGLIGGLMFLIFAFLGIMLNLF